MALDNNTVVNYTDKTTIKNWFKTGLKPTQKQFWSTGDSFWHKSESLPISSISGLGDLIDGKAEENHEHNQYATNDATSLTAENVTAWQNKLGVADLKFDDQAITITQDYTDFGLVAGDSINAFNNAVYTEVAKKLDAPTENATNEYVILGDGSTTPKGDLGKNFSNTDLEITENRKHTGTASVELAMPMIYSNVSQRFSGLVDKSADATYNAVLGMDNQGNSAKITQSANLLEKTLQGTTSEQALRIAQLLNGGVGSSGVMNVTNISPVYMGRNDSQTIVLTGTNLYLNAFAFSVSLIKDGVEYVVPNENVELNPVGNSLTFMVNSSIMPFGDYVVKLVSGVKVYTSTLTILLLDLDNIVIKDFSGITWENNEISKDLYPNFIPNNIIQNGVFLDVKPPTEQTTNKIENIVNSICTSTLFISSEDFILEIDISFKPVYTMPNAYFGLGNTNLANGLTNNSTNYIRFIGAVLGGNAWGANVYNQNSNVAGWNSNFKTSAKVTFVKQGNLLRTIFYNTYKQTLVLQEDFRLNLNIGQPFGNFTIENIIGFNI